MDHPIRSDNRLANPASRFYRKIFRPHDPYGWADYHVVPERRGTLWIHCHGARRRIGADLEFVAVPPGLRDVALDLMFAIIRHLRVGRAVSADTSLNARLVSKDQSFAHLATFRAGPRTDGRHRGSLRIADRGEPMNAGFPYRLFAAHLVAQAEEREDAKGKESLFRHAIEIFPGDFGGDNGAEFDPAEPDLTVQQNRSNLAAYTGLAEILRAQRRMGEAAGFLEAAIARCPAWAMAYREHLMQAYSPDDPYMRYWKDANIGEISLRRQAAEAGTAKAPSAPAGPARKPGFGRRPRGVADFL